jgi:co-chaperonin GroES (HSP10)
MAGIIEVKALKNNVVLAEVKKDNTTAAGIILSGDVETGAKPGIVMAVGPDVKSVAEGDKVAVRWGEALAVSENGTQLAVISEDHVYAIFEE